MRIGDIEQASRARVELLTGREPAWDEVEPLLGEFLETLRDGVIVVGADSRVKYLNSSYLRLFDLGPSEIHVGQDLYRALLVLAQNERLGEAEGRTPEQLATLRAKTWGAPEQRVERRLLPGGRALDIFRTESTTGDVFSVCVDVTDAHRETEEFKLHQTYMQSVLANTSDAITLIDAEGRFAMFNDKLLELYEVDPDKVYWGIPYDEMVAEFGDMRRLGPAEKKAEAERRHRFAFDPTILTIQRPLSNGRTLNINKTNLPGGGCVLTIRDITEDLRREAELITARQIAEQSNRHKSEFVARMSHEMRTPMNGILGSAALMDRMGLTAEQQSLLDVITASGDVLLRLIDDVLDLSRLDADAVEMVDEDVDIAALVDQSIGIVRPAASAQGLDLRIGAMPEQIPTLRGDAVRIQQILLNLLTNAVKFTEQGHVELSLDQSAGPEGMTLAFAVTDTGVGIAEDKLEQIFERFYQIDSTVTRRHGGAGLGLAITQRLVDLMGGTIQVASSVGKGTVFRVTLTLPRQNRCTPVADGIG